MVFAPTNKDFATPTPPDTNKAPVDVDVESVVPLTLTFPVTVVLAPTNKDFTTPTPPDTIKAPVDVDVESVVELTLTDPLTSKCAVGVFVFTPTYPEPPAANNEIRSDVSPEPDSFSMPIVRRPFSAEPPTFS